MGEQGGVSAGDQIPKQIDHYQIHRRIGRGGQGDVYLGHDPNLDIEVAIKVLAAGAQQSEFAQRFQTEARTAVRLTAPNVVRVYNFNPNYPYLVMEYCGDGDLNHRIKSREPLPLGRTIGLIRQICEGLCVAHEHKPTILHRDLKPGNVLFVGDTPKVADFGLAKMLVDADAGMTTTRGMMGTLSYSSPEQIKDASSVDHRADIWSVGVMLYELLTFRRPFDKPGDDYVNVAIKVRMEPPAPPPYDVPAPIWSVVERALEKEPEDRFGSSREMMAALDEASRQLADSVELRLPPAGSLGEIDQLASEVATRLSSGSTDGLKVAVGQMKSINPDHSLPRYWGRQVQEALSASVTSQRTGASEEADWLESRLNSVRSLIGKREFREARRQVGELLVKDPDNSVVQQYIQRIGEEEARLATSINEAHAAADAGRQAGDVQAVFDAWQSLDEAYPDHPEIQAELAVAKRELKQRQQGTARAAVAAEAAALIGTGDLESAVAVWDRYLSQHPDDGEALKQRRELGRKLSETERERRLEKAESAAADHVARGDLSAAIEVWEQVLVEDPSAEKAFARVEQLRRERDVRVRDEARNAALAKARQHEQAGDLEAALGVWRDHARRHPGDDDISQRITQLEAKIDGERLAAQRRTLELRRLAVSSDLNGGRYASIDGAEATLRAALERASSADTATASELKSVDADLAEAARVADRQVDEAVAAQRAELLARTAEVEPLLDDELAADRLDEVNRATRRAHGVLCGSQLVRSADPLPSWQQAIAGVDKALERARASRDAGTAERRELATIAIATALEASQGAPKGSAWRDELGRLEPELSRAGADRLDEIVAIAESIADQAGAQSLAVRAGQIARAESLEDELLGDDVLVREPDLLLATASLSESLDRGAELPDLEALRRQLEAARQSAPAGGGGLEGWKRVSQGIDADPASPILKHWMKAGVAARDAGDDAALDRAAAGLTAALEAERWASAWEASADAVERSSGAASRELGGLRKALVAGDAAQLQSAARALPKDSGGGDTIAVASADDCLSVDDATLAYNRDVGNPALPAWEKAAKAYRNAKGTARAEMARDVRRLHARLVSAPKKPFAWQPLAAVAIAILVVGAVAAWAFAPASVPPGSVTLLSLGGDRGIARIERDGQAVPPPDGAWPALTASGVTLALAPGSYRVVTDDGVTTPFELAGGHTVFVPPADPPGADALYDALGLGE